MNPNEILIGVVTIVIGAAIIGTAKGIIKMYTCLRQGQETITKNLSDGLNAIAITHTKVEGRLAVIDGWCTAHAKSDDDHFLAIRESIKDVGERIS